MPDNKPDRDEKDLPAPLPGSPGENQPAKPDADSAPASANQPAGGSQSQPAGEGREDVPDWLLEYRRKAGQQPAAAPKPPAAEEPPAAAEPAAGREELPDWLIEYRRRTGQLRPAAAEPPGTNEPGQPTGEGLPDWLDEYSSARMENDIQSPEDALGRLRRAPTGATPDWVKQSEADQASEKPVSQTPEEGAPEAGEPEWLKGMPHLPFPVQTVEKPAPGQEPAAQEPPAAPQEAAGLPDWLQQAPQKEAPAEAALPDWLQESPTKGSLEETPAEAALPDWLQGTPGNEAPSEAELPDWLQKAPDKEPPVDAELPDWLKQPSGEEPSPAVYPEGEAAPLPDWLRDAVGRDELIPTIPGEPGLPAGETGAPPTPSSEPQEEPAIPAWLAEVGSEAGTAASDLVQAAPEEEINLDELDAKQTAMAYWAGPEVAAAWAAEQRAKHAAQQAAHKPSRRLAPAEPTASPVETFSDLPEGPSTEPIAPPEQTEDAISEVRRALAEEEQARPLEKPSRVKRLAGGLAGLGAAMSRSRRKEEPSAPAEAELPALPPPAVSLPPSEYAPEAPTELPVETRLAGPEAGQPPEALELTAGEEAAPPAEGQADIPLVEPPVSEAEAEKKGRLARMVTGALIAGRAASGRLRGKPASPEPEPLSEDEIERRLGLEGALTLGSPAPGETVEEEDLRREALGELEPEAWPGLDTEAAVAAPEEEISLEDILGERAEALGEQPAPGETPAGPTWDELEVAAPAEAEGEPGFDLGFEPEAAAELETDVMAPEDLAAPEELVASTAFEEIRSVALEDYVPPTPPPPPSAAARRSLIQVGVVAGIMVLVTLCSCCLGLYAFQGQLRAMLVAPPAMATPTASPYPEPVRLILPGGWPMDLQRGGIQNGQWIPVGAEWLGGTEINRWIAIPWGKELEAVFRTINKDDTIVLEMNNNDKLEYRVAFVQEVPRGMVAQTWTNEPSLTIVLSRGAPVTPVEEPLPETRWMIVAYPK